jgi:hypothetical protein
MQFFLTNRVVQEEGLYAYNMRNIAEKHFSISIVLVRSQRYASVLHTL